MTGKTKHESSHTEELQQTPAAKEHAPAKEHPTVHERAVAKEHSTPAAQPAEAEEYSWAGGVRAGYDPVAGSTGPRSQLELDAGIV